MNKIIVFARISACLLLLAASLAHAADKKAVKFYKLGQKAELQKQYDQAVNDYDQALALEPTDAAYLMAGQRAHTKAAEWHIEKGKTLQQTPPHSETAGEIVQRLNDALVEFQRAMLDEPSSQIALQQIRATNAMIAETRKTGQPVVTPAERARQELEKRVNSLEGPPQLKPITDLISTLKINNEPARVLYESVGKLAGINVLLDPTGIEGTSGGRFNLDLKSVTLQEALDYVALETHTFWKPISRNAIFVTQENQPKRQEYQDEIIKVFYVQNASTPAEFTEIFNAVRTGAKLNQGIYQVASQNAIVARGPQDAVSLVEKIIHDLDRPKAEVVVDVIVMEVNKTKTTTIGAALLGQGGFSQPITFNPRNPVTVGTGTTGTTTTGTTTTGTTGTGTTGNSGLFTVAQLGHLSSADFATSLPSALLQALLTDTSSKILQRPQLRCTDGGKASLKIGEKIPYVSGSLNSAVATPGSIPYATTQFQQIDVGVNIDLEPHVNGVDDVSMHIKVEISNTNGNENIGGIAEPIITQRINDSFLRMRDGEVGLLGGLSDKETDNSLSGFPGLVNIPILGPLFGAKTKTNSDDEILIAIIPHIVRAPDYSNVGDAGVYAGSEQTVHVHRKTVVTGDDGVDGQGKPDGPGNSQKNVPVVPPTAPGPPYTTTPPPHQ